MVHPSKDEESRRTNWCFQPPTILRRGVIPFSRAPSRSLAVRSTLPPLANSFADARELICRRNSDAVDAHRDNGTRRTRRHLGESFQESVRALRVRLTPCAFSTERIPAARVLRVLG